MSKDRLNRRDTGLAMNPLPSRVATEYATRPLKHRIRKPAPTQLGAIGTHIELNIGAQPANLDLIDRWIWSEGGATKAIAKGHPVDAIGQRSTPLPTITSSRV